MERTGSNTSDTSTSSHVKRSASYRIALRRSAPVVKSAPGPDSGTDSDNDSPNTRDNSPNTTVKSVATMNGTGGNGTPIVVTQQPQIYPDLRKESGNGVTAAPGGDKPELEPMLQSGKGGANGAEPEIGGALPGSHKASEVHYEEGNGCMKWCCCWCCCNYCQCCPNCCMNGMVRVEGWFNGAADWTLNCFRVFSR